MRRSNNHRQPAQRPAIGRAARYLSHYPVEAILPYTFLVIATLSQLAVPRMVSNVIDAATGGVTAKYLLSQLPSIPLSFLGQALPRILAFLKLPDGMTLDQLTAHLQATQDGAPRAILIAGLSIVGLAILRGAFAFAQTYYAQKNSESVAYDLRNDLYSKIQTLSFSYHDRNNTGQLMIRATDDVEKVRLFIGQGLLQLVSALLLLAGTLIILFTTNARLAVVALWILPVALGLFVVFGIVSRPLFTKIQQKLSALNTTLQENMAGIRVVKAFTREKSEQAKFGDQADKLMNQQLMVARLFTTLFPLTFLIANLGQASVLFAGGNQIIQGTLSLGEWQEFSLYLIYLFLPIAQFGFIITQFGQASASAARIFDILDAENVVSDKPGAAALPPVSGDIRFESVGFRYFSSGSPVLKGVDFEVKAGQSVALLGATGSGKTSIINLLPRFYDPSEGRITIDGHDLRDVTLDSLRSQIGIVLQETTLFAGTIRENIAFGRSNATLDEIQAAARAAAADEFIRSFPDGYDTPVGERGTTLSGGQKQRIAIARALLLDPKILILDDSTSSVDLATEAEIQSALDLLMSGRTSFVIAQRISTVMRADLILVLDKGEIVARGKHTDLMEISEIYADIYSSQLVGDPVSTQSQAV
ncbi:MAG TPA: ABC transporter ATP-binding protein [Anaerolineales bacterium]|nr:ABC transporter ATP-binding protein [Anaerolineales bacterium]